MVGIDALFGAIHKEIEGYRDSKQKEKNNIKKALLSIEISLDSSLIKINLCKKHGHYTAKKLQVYIPDIALEIHEIAKATRDIFPREVYDGLITLANQFVSFNEEINSLYIGKSYQQDLVKLLEEISRLKELLKEINSKK